MPPHILGYIIERTDQGGGYVNQPGSRKSYTRNRFQAQRFPTAEAADAARCPGNEVVVILYDTQ